MQLRYESVRSSVRLTVLLLIYTVRAYWRVNENRMNSFVIKSMISIIEKQIVKSQVQNRRKGPCKRVKEKVLRLHTERGSNNEVATKEMKERSNQRQALFLTRLRNQILGLIGGVDGFSKLTPHNKKRKRRRQCGRTRK